MTVKFDAFATPPSRELVEEFERRHGIEFPSDYRDFLLKTNGGRCSGGAVFRSYASREELSAINTLLGLSSVPHESLDHNYSNVVDLLPSDVFPIGYDSGGNYLLLDCGVGASYGAVYFSTLEHLDELETANRTDLNLVAKSFTGLLEDAGLRL
jgi:hypothetical protein